MNRLIRQQLDRVKQGRERLNQSQRWPLILAASIVWGIAIWQIYRTEFLAGFWGITNDEIAVVTIERDDSDNGETSTETIIIQDPSKSFWDGLQLLGVPLVLAVLGAWFQKSQQEQAERTAKEQREQDADETREEVLQLYFDRISTLLIDKNLMAIASKGDDASPESKELLETSLDVIRARTLSILRRFEKDIDRKRSIVRFLAEAEIISKLKLALHGADLHGVNLRWANLKQANLQATKLTEADLTRADLTGADLHRANLTGTDLHETNLYGIDLHGANLEDTNLKDASFKEANLKDANLLRANLKGANLKNANLLKANLEGANLEDANLKEANLKGANLESVNDDWFEETNPLDLDLNDFQGMNLEGANLEDANLKGARLQWSNLESANLEGANLEGADLERSHLESANLKEANLLGTNLSNISFNDYTIWPDKYVVATAKNIPDTLKKQFGLLPRKSRK